MSTLLLVVLAAGILVFLWVADRVLRKLGAPEPVVYIIGLILYGLLVKEAFLGPITTSTPTPPYKPSFGQYHSGD